MKAQDPQSGEWKFFVDKCLPFGASISCAIFQTFSDALKFLIEKRTSIPDSVTNYLDDFLFLALTIWKCNTLIQNFLDMCQSFGIPIALEKTEWANHCTIFLGMLLDWKEMVLRIPLDKRNKAIKMLKNFSTKRESTVKNLQELCGYLNFLCKAIFPGRPFLRRMYAKYSKYAPIPTHKRELKNKYYQTSRIKQHHHMRLEGEFRMDCQTWLKFLDQDAQLCSIVNRPMIDLLAPELTSREICFYSDASAAARLGYGCIYNTKWIQGHWDESFIRSYEPSIEYLELYALTAGLLMWESLLQNCRITIFCDNKGVVGMLNKLTSSCQNCMVLIRLITLNGLQFNRRVNAKYVSSKDNDLAEALSRGQMSRFRKLGPHMDLTPCQIDERLWPVTKIWKH